jgi:hypothetical protein
MRWPWVSRGGFEALQTDFRLVSAAFERESREMRQLAAEVVHLRRRLDAYDAEVYQREREADNAEASLVEALESGKVVAIAAWRSRRMVA